MTGLPTLLVELDDGTGTFPHDITEYVRLSRGWEVSRGRGNEFGDVQPGRLTISLDNRDGRFTIGNPTYDVEVDQRIRLTETVGATTSARHTGYVEDWPHQWESPTANIAVCGITSLDRFTRLARRNMPASLLQGEILRDGPVAYYTLGEPTGATSAGDTSGRLQASLTQSGTGTAIVFGTAAGPEYDDLTAAQFAGGVSLTAPIVGGTAAWSVDVFVLRSGLPAASEAFCTVGTSSGNVVLSIDTLGQLTVVDGVGGFTGFSGVIADGQTHHIALSYSGGVISVRRDGIGYAPIGGSVAAAPNRLTLGPLTGVLAHAAVYPSALSAARMDAHYAASVGSFTDDSGDERIARLAAYAKIPTSEQDLEPGALTGTGAQGGGKLLPAMQQVNNAEGGGLFVDGEGSLVFQSRTHRVHSATGTPALVLEVSEVDHDDLTIGGAKDYLVNTVSGSREGGAVLRAVDEASVLEFDEYPDDLSGLLVLTDEQVRDAITWRKSAYSEPQPRLSSVTIDLFTSSTALQQAVLALELGDRSTISGWPTQAPWATADLLIEGIRERQSLSEWKVTFNTVPAELFHAWVLGDATHGVLGTTTRLHY